MELTEQLVAAAAKRVHADGETSYGGRALPFALPFRRLRMTDGIAAALQGTGLAPLD